MKLYNTASKKIEELNPIVAGKVGIYSCGPTVYWNQHIGHMYAYVQWDTLVRLLRYLGMEVTWVMNITDVGHLVSDEDTGEDKMEKGAKRENVSVWTLAEKYITQFKDSLDLLNITKPQLMRATEYISDQINLAKVIEKNGFTYETKKGLVFDTSKFSEYSKFAGLNLDKQKKREDVADDPEKKNPWDFFLWAKDTKHVMQWESPWGIGYPGWHIECTAMSTKALGDRFDIHTGGIEHIGVHHTNEIAQGFGAFGHQTANYWLHNAWLLGKSGEKMSKSLGNFVTVQEVVEKGYDPLALRYLFLTSHYRKGLAFSYDSLDAAQVALFKARQIVAQAKASPRNTLSEAKLDKINLFRASFEEAFSDDLNASKALSVLWEVLKSNIPSEDKYDLATAFDQVLGLELTKETHLQIPDEVQELAKARQKLRASGDFVGADDLRSQIAAKGFVVKDQPNGFELKEKKIN